MKGHFYILKLLKYMKMNNIFHADYLRKTADNLMLKQIQKSDSLTEVNDQLKYEVDRVLTS